MKEPIKILIGEEIHEGFTDADGIVNVNQLADVDADGVEFMSISIDIETEVIQYNFYSGDTTQIGIEGEDGKIEYIDRRIEASIISTTNIKGEIHNA